MKNQKSFLRKTNGITLVALVVTIVVLIILATISINAVLGENGIIRRAEIAGEHQANAEASDREALDVFDGHIANAIAGNGGSTQTPTDPENPEGGNNPPPTTDPTIKEVTLAQAKDNSMLSATENAKMTIGEDIVWIPAGFKVHEESASVVDEGIVITDGTNEFVWVPVSEESFGLMFKTAAPAVALSGSTGVTTNYYSNLRQTGKDDDFIVASATNGMYSSSNGTIREPDVITGIVTVSQTYYDETEIYYTAAGFDSSTEMAEAFVEDYTNMRASIEKYDGFYIGRYELTGTTTSPTVKAGAVLTADSSQAGNWYGLYKACRDVVTDDTYATSTMIWGCQWDETMNWLKNTKFKGNESAVDTDSSSWGNYSDYNTNNEYEEGDAEYISVAGSMQNTRYSKYWSANKIYDLAGNCYEWTQEAYNTEDRVQRGGVCKYPGEALSASDRNYVSMAEIRSRAINAYSDRTARVTLYVNP